MKKYNLTTQFDNYLYENFQQYDFIMGLGESCFCSLQLRAANLQNRSYPFDWSGAIKWDGSVWPEAGELRGLERKINLIIQGCNDILNKEDLAEFPRDPFATELRHRNLRNIKTGLQYLHDFPLDQSIDQAYDEVKQRYARRISRMYDKIENSQKILFVFFTRDLDLKDIEKITKKFENNKHKKVDWLFCINDDSLKSEEIHLNKNDNIILIKYREKNEEGCLNQQIIQKILSAINLHTKDENEPTKKIAFVAHEFGLFPGHGGIASYLYNTCKYILENRSENIYILIKGFYDVNCDLLKSGKLKIIPVNDDFDVYTKLKQINPDYVELADYLALGLHSLMQKRQGTAFSNTIFSVHHHTASRECFEWNSKIPIKFAPGFIQESYMKEQLQILLSDMQVSPSTFMSMYVQKNYDLKDNVFSFNHINIQNDEKKQDILKKLTNYCDLSEYQNSFNVFLISRIEGRKNQELLIDQFIKFRNKINESANLFLVGNTNRDEITGEEYNFKLFKKIPSKERKYIHFMDFMNHEQQKKIIAIGDLCILASPYESFSIALGETILKGIPGMASKYTGCCDYMGKTTLSMTFDPFKPDDLLNKMLNYFNMSFKERNNILLEQQSAFYKATQPLYSIDRRLNLAYNLCTYLDKQNKKDWKTITDRTCIDINKGDSIILLSNSYNEETINNFAQNFDFVRNLENKIVILNNGFSYIDNIQLALNLGLPIFIPNLDKDIPNSSYTDILDYLRDKNDKIVEICYPHIKTTLNKKYTDYFFFNDIKINLGDRI